MGLFDKADEFVDSSIEDVIGEAEQRTGVDKYNVWMAGAAAAAITRDKHDFADDTAQEMLTRCLEEAKQSGGDVDWADRDQLEEVRRTLVLDDRSQRAVEEYVGVSATKEIVEQKAYVGTVTAAEGNAEEIVEEALDEWGFRRNPVAHLKFRFRDGEKEYEQSSWTYREGAEAPKQLHVRLFDGEDTGTVDVYAHYENSTIRGEDHFQPMDYERGVCATHGRLTDWAAGTDGITLNRMNTLPTGTSPKEYECSTVDAVFE